MTRKLGIILLSVSVISAFLIWLFVESSKPPPGEKITDLGRGHVPIGEQVEYNSNPPTSGKHYGDWIRAGVYSEAKDDKNLVHSLEHGYIIMHYKCNIPVIPSTSEGSLTNVSQNKSGDSSPSAQSDSEGQQCNDRKNQLAQIYEKKGQKKLIVIPRPNLDTNFALTAWNYLDKFDSFDSSKIEKFIDAHLNQGPEKTME